jgi:pimeloyl-ACP methyl ester carboxylesterase
VVSISDVAQDIDLTGLAAGLPALGNARLRVSIGDESTTLVIDDSGVSVGDSTVPADVTYSLTNEQWSTFTENPPPRGFTSAQAMHSTLKGECFSGDRVVWAQYAVLLDRFIEALRTGSAGERPDRNPSPSPRLGQSPIRGGYITVDINGDIRRIYYETAGSGQPVLCLHTAGADSRQFRYLLEDDELTATHQFVAFDMPWHGRSDPPEDWAEQHYALTTEVYAATVLAVMRQLSLEKPILIGCSMGGAIALYLASTAGDAFTAVCALEGGLGNPGRFVPWTNHQEVDHSHFLTSWVGGLIAPSSPTAPRSMTLWGYAQSGPGVYQGDTNFYSNDLPAIAESLGRATCPLWVFSGEYDYSATTEMSRAAVEKIGGELVVMTGSGHFPMSEDPVVFRSFLAPVLTEISQRKS